MRIVKLDQRTDDWKAWRRQGITATDAVVILGSPYKTPWRLWMEKTGKALAPDLSANPRVAYGVQHEDDARRLFEEKYGEFVEPACAESDENPVLRASFDGLTLMDQPVEIKCPSKTVLDDVKALGRNSTAYKHYYTQVQYQMLVADADRGWLVFYDGGEEEGKPPSIIDFEIARDDAFLADLKAKCLAFYDSIVKREEPPRDPARDVFMPQPEEVGEWTAAAQQYLKLQAEINRRQAEIEDMKALQAEAQETLKRIMGDNFQAEFGGIAITRSVVKGKVDYQALAEGLSGRKPTADEIESFRGKSTERWLFRATGELLPKEIVDPELRARAEEAEPEGDLPAIYL